MIRLSTEIYTRNVEQAEEFYCKHFGFKVKTRAEGFIVLQHSVRNEFELMFCVPNSKFVHEIFHPEFKRQGVLFQFEVKDVEAEYKRIRNAGLEIVVPLIDEPVNGKHFTMIDPSGVLLDIVQFSEQN